MANRVNIDQEAENTRTKDTTLVRHSSVTEDNVFASHNANQYCVLNRRHVSRLSSSESAECPDSIFDYHSTHPSVDLDELCCDSVAVGETSTGLAVAEVDMNGEVVGDVITSQSAASAAVHVQVNSQNSASKSELPPSSSSGLPSLIPPSRMQSRLPAPRSRNALKVTSEQLPNGLTSGSAAVPSAGTSAVSKAGPSRFH